MKKLVSIIVVVMLLVTAVPSVVSASPARSTDVVSGSFSDVPASAWYAASVEEALANGVMHGVGNRKFNPGGTLTEAEAGHISYNIYEPSHGSSNPWHKGGRDFVERETGVILSSSSSQFASRGLIVLMMYRFDGDDTIRRVPFSDMESESFELQQAAAWASDKGVVSGYPDGTFRPWSSITRAEAARMFVSWFQKFHDTTFEDSVSIESARMLNIALGYGLAAYVEQYSRTDGVWDTFAIFSSGGTYTFLYGGTSKGNAAWMFQDDSGRWQAGTSEWLTSWLKELSTKTTTTKKEKLVAEIIREESQKKSFDKKLRYVVSRLEELADEKGVPVKSYDWNPDNYAAGLDCWKAIEVGEKNPIIFIIGDESCQKVSYWNLGNGKVKQSSLWTMLDTLGY